MGWVRVSMGALYWDRGGGCPGGSMMCRRIFQDTVSPLEKILMERGEEQGDKNSHVTIRDIA